MKNFSWIVVLLISLFGCNNQKPKYDSPVYQQLAEVDQEARESMYRGLKKRINYKQKLFNEEYARSNEEHQKTLVALSKKYIGTVLTDTIFPFWYDTEWDYNGTTTVPGRGDIACGYFVSTTLKHAGFNVDRVKLAQQASSRIIESICGTGKTHIIGNNDHQQLEAYMINQPNGLYILGLDNHVGFIHKADSSVNIVHSNGVSGSLMVVKEPISKSKLVLRSNAYYIGSIFANNQLFVNWIRKSKIKTITT